MTENELRGVVVAQAKGWLGRGEADGSHREIIDVYNSIVPLPRGYRMSYTDPWCAAFVSAVAQAVELTDILYPECACDRMIELYRQHGRWMEDDAYVPRPGDLLFYDWQDTGIGDNTGSADHVGIVADVDGGRISLVEGNCGDAVCRQVREVGGLYIRGYGLPDYGAEAEDEDPSVLRPPPLSGEDTSGGEGSVALPTLMLGDKNEAVRAAQALLMLRRCGVGPDGADGDFGPNTRSAVLRFQARAGLDHDGVVGPATWNALLRG